MSGNSFTSPPSPPPPPKLPEDQRVADIAHGERTGSTRSSPNRAFPVTVSANDQPDLDRKQRSPADNVTAADSRLEYSERREAFVAKIESWLRQSDYGPAPETDGEVFLKENGASRPSPLPRVSSGYAGSTHSSSRSALGLPDLHSENALTWPRSSLCCMTGSGPQSSRSSIDGILDVSFENVRYLGSFHTWEEFCELQLVAFLQVCTLAEVYDLQHSPLLLRVHFQQYLKRMISRCGNADFLSFQASPKFGPTEVRLQMLRHQKSMFSRSSRSSISSRHSRSSQRSASTKNSFSSQISDDTMLNDVQLEAKGLRDCIINIQKKMKYLEKESQGQQSNGGEEGPAAKLTSSRTLLEVNETALRLLDLNEGRLGDLGFSNMALLFAKYKGELRALYKDLNNMNPYSKLQKVFRPRRSRREIIERHEIYSQIEELVREMIDRAIAALETAEAQKDAFIAAGRQYADLSIIESAAELGYSPSDKYEGSPGTRLVTRKFVKLDNPRHQRHGRLQKSFSCNCCPKEPKKFDTTEELVAHEQGKRYKCLFCERRFEDSSEVKRHQNFLHSCYQSWSCAALNSYQDVFFPSSTRFNLLDGCGYCGEIFVCTGPISEKGIRTVSERDWEWRWKHLKEVHNFGKCDHKRFFKDDHFREHLKDCHAGTSGRWIDILIDRCTY